MPGSALGMGWALMVSALVELACGTFTDSHTSFLVSVYPSTSFTHPLTHPSIHASIHLTSRLSFHPPTHPPTPFAHLPLQQTAHPCIYPSVYPSVHALYLPAHPIIHLPRIPFTSSLHPFPYHLIVHSSVHTSTHPFNHPIHTPTVCLSILYPLCGMLTEPYFVADLDEE